MTAIAPRQLIVRARSVAHLASMVRWLRYSSRAQPPPRQPKWCGRRWRLSLPLVGVRCSGFRQLRQAKQEPLIRQRGSRYDPRETLCTCALVTLQGSPQRRACTLHRTNSPSAVTTTLPQKQLAFLLSYKPEKRTRSLAWPVPSTRAASSTRADVLSMIHEKEKSRPLTRMRQRPKDEMIMSNILLAQVRLERNISSAIKRLTAPRMTWHPVACTIVQWQQARSAANSALLASGVGQEIQEWEMKRSPSIRSRRSAREVCTRRQHCRVHTRALSTDFMYLPSHVAFGQETPPNLPPLRSQMKR